MTKVCVLMSDILVFLYNKLDNVLESDPESQMLFNQY